MDNVDKIKKLMKNDRYRKAIEHRAEIEMAYIFSDEGCEQVYPQYIITAEGMIEITGPGKAHFIDEPTQER